MRQAFPHLQSPCSTYFLVILIFRTCLNSLSAVCHHNSIEPEAPGTAADWYKCIPSTTSAVTFSLPRTSRAPASDDSHLKQIIAPNYLNVCVVVSSGVGEGGSGGGRAIASCGSHQLIPRFRATYTPTVDSLLQSSVGCTSCCRNKTCSPPGRLVLACFLCQRVHVTATSNAMRCQ